ARPPDAPRTAARGSRPVLRLVSVPEPDAEPAPRLRHVLPRLPEGSLPYHGRLGIPVPARGDRRPRALQAPAGGRALGPDLQTGLGRVRAGADRCGLARVHDGRLPAAGSVPLLVQQGLPGPGGGRGAPLATAV